MIQNNLLNSCLSGFRPNHSCINQLISITQNICCAFDTNPSLEVLGSGVKLISEAKLIETNNCTYLLNYGCVYINFLIKHVLEFQL